VKQAVEIAGLEKRIVADISAWRRLQSTSDQLGEDSQQSEVARLLQMASAGGQFACDVTTALNKKVCSEKLSPGYENKKKDAWTGYKFLTIPSSFWKLSNVERWDLANTLAFNHDPGIHFKQKTGANSLGSTATVKSPFKDKKACLMFYKNVSTTFGFCGKKLGGRLEAWRKMGCPPNMTWKKITLHWHVSQSHALSHV
jgi:hypothetical protein